jgi:ATP-dependent DNA helicase RecG
VGPQRARLLERLGLLTVRDALNHFPRDYQDRRDLVSFHALRAGEVGVVAGSVFGVAPPPRGHAKAPLWVTFRDQQGYFTCRWYGQAYLARVFQRGQRVILYGKVAAERGKLFLDRPDFEIVEDEPSSIHMGRMVPVYSLTEGLTQRPMRTLLHRVVEAFADQAPETLPGELRRRRDLLPAREAYRAVHFPESPEAAQSARRRFVFEDFLLLQLGLALRRRRQAVQPGQSLAPPGALVARLLAGLPFELTKAQGRVWDEICADLARPTPMNRLLQGDVGSGKTIVAAMALVTAVEAGYQAVLMAPTEILAEQHLTTVRGLLEPLGIPVGSLGRPEGRERQGCAALRSGRR